MNRIKVNPAEGLPYVLDKLSRKIVHKENGTSVPKESFYVRLIKAGDLVEVKEKIKQNKKGAK